MRISETDGQLPWETPTATFERLSAILVRENKLAPERLTTEARLDSLDIDSLGSVELLWHIEDCFKVKLPSEPVDLATLGDVVVFIDGLLAQQTSAASPSPAAASGSQTP